MGTWFGLGKFSLVKLKISCPCGLGFGTGFALL